MKKAFFIAAFLFAANTSFAFRVFNSQVSDFQKVGHNLYSCKVSLYLAGQQAVCYVDKSLMNLIKANRVSLDLKWDMDNKSGKMKFWLVPTFDNIPR